MAKIVDYREISLDDLVIGRGQVRTENPGAEIEDLAHSIKAQGLLQPIVVCQARNGNKWEILTGQRRFLAHKLLKKPTITAAILDEKVEEEEAKAISITENLIRRKLTGKELIDGISYLYKKYGSVKDVVKATGLPNTDVQRYVKYPRLIPELKQLVDNGEVDINVALKAQDGAQNENGDPDPTLAIKLVEEMKPMTGYQRDRFTKERKRNRSKPIDDAIEEAKSSANVTQVIVTLSQSVHSALGSYAKEEQTTQDGAAAALIEEGLIGNGLLKG